MVKVTVDGELTEYERGTTYLQIAKDFQKNYEHDIILAKRGEKLIELNKSVNKEQEITFLTTASDSGYKTYVRGVTLLLLRSFYHVAGEKGLENVFVKHTLGDNVYCEAEGIELTKELLDQVEQFMHSLVEQDKVFHKKSVSTSSAVETFEKYGMKDKKKLFEYRRVSKVNIYNLDGFEDYYYGYMPPSTGILKYFRLEKYDKGFLIRLPNRKHPETLA